VAKGQKGDAGMLFDLASKFSALCRTSEQNGRGDGGREEGEDKQPHIPLRLGFGILPGVCGKSARTGFRLFPGSGDLPQSPANVGAV
jgi:hypothetical protein